MPEVTPGPMPGTDAADLLQRLAEDIPRRGQLAARMTFKRELVARVGVQEAFAIAAPHLAVPRLQTLQRRRLRPMIDAARQDSLEYRELWPGGQVQALPAMQVVGECRQEPCSIATRSMYLACLDDVLLRGRSDLLLRKGEALIDLENVPFDPATANAEFDPGVLHAEADHLWTMEPEGPVPRLKEALMLTGARTLDFGHWLIEYLPKLAIARLAGWNGGMPVLVDRTTPDNVRNALQAMLPPDAPLHTVGHLAPIRVDRLWCMPDTFHLGFYPSQSGTGHLPQRLAMAHWRAVADEIFAMGGAAAAEPTGIDRLYLARRPERKKKLVNHAEIEALVARHGFTLIYPEDHSLIEQMRFVRHARFIVAPEGSNAALSIFCSPGAQVCTLTSPQVQQLVIGNAIFDAMGCQATLFLGPMATDSPTYTTEWLFSFWNDYRIDATAFEAYLAGWLAGR
jgi:capsular polysaccharide biosynthesis protein